MAARKGWKGASDKRDTLASILGVLEDLKAGNIKLRVGYVKLKTCSAELIVKELKELVEAKVQLEAIKAQLADVVSMVSNLLGIGQAQGVTEDT